MQFAPGTDFICSGYSSTPNYDNMFAGSNWDAEDYDDWTVIQRDLKVNGGLIPAREEEVVEVRNKAAHALQALFKALGLPPITDQEVERLLPMRMALKICLLATRLQILKRLKIC